MDFVEICNVCARKLIIEAAKRIINSDKVCHSYSDLNFGATFFGTQCRSGGTFRRSGRTLRTKTEPKEKMGDAVPAALHP